MNPAQLLATLRARGAAVSVRGERLRIEAPVGVLDGNVRAALATQKAELIRLLSETAEPAPADAARLLAARETDGTAELLADGMCMHISEKARRSPANVGRTVRCAACFLAAHPDWQPHARLAELRAPGERLQGPRA